MENSAVVAKDKLRAKCVAHATYVISPVSALLQEPSVKIKFKKRDDLSPFSNAGILWLKVNSKWYW
eukprot:753421-Hanusia_phi.AAC.4